MRCEVHLETDFRATARVLVVSMLLCLVTGGAPAVSLDQTPITGSARVALSTARSKCISESGPVPSWTGKAHPDCSVEWSELGTRGRRVLYRARYQWPSTEDPDTVLDVVTEVLFEGRRGGKQVMSLFVIQCDEGNEFLTR
jgi:hypothetical protein